MAGSRQGICRPVVAWLAVMASVLGISGASPADVGSRVPDVPAAAANAALATAPATNSMNTTASAAMVAHGPVRSRVTAHGAVGVGTYNTVAQFKDLRVTAVDGRPLLQADLAKGLDDWYFHGGQWKVLDDSVKQSLGDPDCWAVIGDTTWTDYRVHVKARKIVGKEGFQVLFRVRDMTSNYCWFNVGGWNNTKAQIEVAIAGTRTAIGTSTNMTVEEDRWYDVQVEVRGENAKCYLDDKLVCEADLSKLPPPAEGRGGNGRGTVVSNALGPVGHGLVGVGTFNTVAEYKNLVVTAPEGHELFQTDLSKGLGNWSTHGGQWKVVDDFVKQSAGDANCWATVGNPNWSDYTVKVKARKVTGKEGFLLLFRVRDPNSAYCWFNVGGWGNTKCQMEVNTGTTRTPVGNATPTTIEADRWYDLQVDVQGNHAKAYVDGKLACEAELLYSPASAVANARGNPKPAEVGTVTQSGTAHAAVSNAARQTSLRDQLQSRDKSKIVRALAEFQKWYGEDPINAEHAFWQLRMLFPPLTNRVDDTLYMIQLAWQSKRAPDGDHSDPGYLYAMESSCLLQLHRSGEALATLRQGLQLDPVHASAEFVAYVTTTAPPRDADSMLVEVLPAIIASKPEDTAMVESALKLRIAALDRLGSYREALADARRLFNVSAMQHTSEALALVDKYWLACHAGDTTSQESFRREQLAGAVLAAGDDARRTSTALLTIAIADGTYQQALSRTIGPGRQDVVRRTSLLLLTGEVDQALSLAQQTLAMTQGNRNETNAANELIARCYKAQDGTVGRANAFVIAHRAPADSAAFENQARAAVPAVDPGLP